MCGRDQKRVRGSPAHAGIDPGTASPPKATPRSKRSPRTSTPARCGTRTGKAQATAAPGAWTGWSTKYNWVIRRAAFVEFTVRECQDATQLGLVQIRRRFIDTANTLLDDGQRTRSSRRVSRHR